MPAPKPKRISIRSYQVGFGDCFLLGFHYKTSDRYVLIDYGSTARPKNSTKDHMMKVAKSIQATCGEDLHAIVATHRHRDHISGFATKADGKGTGDVIGALKPDLVIQPWTEDPSAQRDANKPTKVSQSGRALIGMLDDMHGVAEVIYKEVQGWRPSGLRSRLSFMGENNIKNLSAVKNLMKMGKKRRYVHFGAKSGLILPGVKVHVLGPPTLEQTDTIRKQRSKDETEFWHLMALTGELSMSARELLFPQKFKALRRPRSSRWLQERMKELRREQVREIVRILDTALNNTSVILLFQVGDQSLLFPGDAQLENWKYALSQPAILQLLKDVTVYKVGHHGSLNATPKTLWSNFDKKSSAQAADRLQTLVSTMKGKHGSESRETEVPRKPLVEALEKNSDYHTTEDVEPKELFHEQTIQVS